ncbi:hypothetical protein MTO96_005783 [Rhipicephalus appendiculatus]
MAIMAQPVLRLQPPAQARAHPLHPTQTLWLHQMFRDVITAQLCPTSLANRTQLEPASPRLCYQLRSTSHAHGVPALCSFPSLRHCSHPLSHVNCALP